MIVSYNDLVVPKSPFLDTQTNRPTREWLMYLLSLGRQPVYGSFMSTTTQNPTAINTPARLAFDLQNYANQMYYTTGDGIHFQQDGLYNLQFSSQVLNSDTQTHDVDIWFRKNGVDVPNTASVFSVLGTHGGQPGYFVVAANFFVDILAGDYIEMWWSTNSTSVSIQSLPAITTPFASPAAPGLVLTIQKVNL